jgi:hypothetical protein
MLVFTSIRASALKAGDIVAFDYGNPGKNQIPRCGEVESFAGTEERRCVTIYDFSLEHGGPGYRTYRVNMIRGLGKVTAGTVRTFSDALREFSEKILPKPLDQMI